MFQHLKLQNAYHIILFQFLYKKLPKNIFMYKLCTLYFLLVHHKGTLQESILRELNKEESL